MKKAHSFNHHAIKHIVRDAVIVSGIAMFLSMPMLFNQFTHMMSSILLVQPNTEQVHFLVIKQAIIVFLVSFLCVLLALLYQQRLNLPRFGQWSDVIWLPLGLIAGLLLTPIAYYFIDQDIIHNVPELYRRSWWMALADMVGNAVVQEIIARLGFLSIVIYFFGYFGMRNNLRPAVIFVALLSALYTYFFWDSHHFTAVISTLQLGKVLLTVFIMQWLFGEIYLRYGFIAAVCAHIGVTLKLFIYAVVVLP